MAAGSEVHLMLEAHHILQASGVKVRSISIPCFGIFKQQSNEYIQSLLPDSCRARVSIEAGRRDHWASLVGLDGEHVGMKSFGPSGKTTDVYSHEGFTCDNIVEVANRVISGKQNSIPSRAD